ncbi:MAG: cohesin domain-containing protein [Thermomicrobiales bacterium]
MSTLLLSVLAIIRTPAVAQGNPPPWETPEGIACFERWISEVERILNAYDGTDQFNARKPWSINEYGLVEGNPQFGPTSVAAPDNFWRYDNNRYWWIWDHYNVSYYWQWRWENWRNAMVPPPRPFVLNCIAETGGASTTGSTGTTGTGSGSGTGNTTTGGGSTGTGAGTGTGTGTQIPPDPTVSGTNPPPFGSPEPANTSAFTIQAGQRRVVAGETVLVPVYLINANDVSNMNYEIGYDGNVVSVDQDVQTGSLLADRLAAANINEAEIVRAGFAGTSGVSGTGSIAWLPFRAIGDPGEFTRLVVTVSEVNDTAGNSPLIELIAGWVQITDEEGRVPGDCDNDGVLREYDAFCALEMSVQLRPEQQNLDRDADSSVTSRDATIILQTAIGIR